MKITNRKRSRILGIGAVLAAVGVGLGAYGAHGLEAMIEERVEDPGKSLEHWTTANRYHLIHALGVLLVGIMISIWPGRRLLKVSATLLIVGILLFSGCLYVLAVSDLKILGAIVPLGGLAWILGWLLVAVDAWFVSEPRLKAGQDED